MNLIEALQKANADSRLFLAEIEESRELLAGTTAAAGLDVAKAVTETLIRKAEAAIASGDVVQMVAAAKAHGIGGGA